MDFDCFLSHNSKDKPAVRELAHRLTDRGIRVWLDEDQLIPGRTWQTLLEQGIERSATGAVLIGRDGLGPWEDEEMQALLRQAVASGKRVIPVLLPGAPKRPRLPLFLANRTWVDLRKGFTDQGIDKLVWGITGERSKATAPPDVSPRRRWTWGIAALATVLLVGLITFWSLRDPEQVLAGSVRDEAGDPIPGVELALPVYGVTTVTDRLGRFELRVRAPHQASVELLARAKGFATRRQYVMLGTERLGFKLQRSAP
jgi:hypothetical protein